VDLYHHDVTEPIAMLLPLNIYEMTPEDIPQRRQAVIDAASEAFGTAPEIDAREINVGRGADAGALLVEIVQAVGLGIALVLGPAELVKRGREAVDEYRLWARKVKKFISNIGNRGFPPTMLSPAVALPIVWTDIETRAGPIERLVWWDEIAVQPFDWVDDPSSFEATAERVYFYIFETTRARWYIATKGDGTIVSEVETMIPRDYTEYHFWPRQNTTPRGES
jgi:hypothetical protein